MTLDERNFFMYTYAWYHWLTFFYLYCFFGWIFESTYVSLKKRHFVNRGFLRLPMLPLYGTGAVMMLWVSLPVKDNLFLVYLSGVIAATILEYITGYLMEQLFKVRYWDYSNQPFNLNGYICLSSSVAWGFLTIFMTEVIHTPIEHLVLNLAPAAEGVFLIIVSILFIYDTVLSTREALNLAHALEAITKLRSELEELQVQLALLKAEASQNVLSITGSVRDTVKETVREALKDSVMEPVVESVVESALAHKEAFDARKEAFDARKEAFDARREALGMRKESIEARISALSVKLSEKKESLRLGMDIRRPSILRRNPGAVSNRFAAALKELHSSWESRKND